MTRQSPTTTIMVASPIAVSVLTPVAPYHQGRIGAIQAVVQAQTVPCHHLIYEDRDGRGAGYARNMLLAQATTPYIIFLDTDDHIAPTFVERALAHHQPGYYIYTDWWQGEQHMQPPDGCDVWRNGTYHTVTTLLETAHARHIGGFDEIMPGAEDSDFYIRLRLSGVCPKRLPEPLFTYHKGGQRSRTLIQGGQLPAVQHYMRERYGGYDMGCCGGDKQKTEQTPAGESFDGAILATAMWAGNRRVVGPVSGRNYPRTGNRKQVYVDQRDVEARPDLWQPVTGTTQETIVLQPRKHTVPVAPLPPAGTLSDIASFFTGQPDAPQTVPFNDIPAAAMRAAEIIAEGQHGLRG